LLRDTSTTAEAEAAAGRLAAALSVPLALDGTVVAVAASIGIALPTPQMNRVDDLLRAADVAMYGAKARGKDRSQVYSPALDAPDGAAIGEPARFRQPTVERGRSHVAAPTGLRPEGI
jgi:predicted signal transduction protein with EAL and GGDEF domain